MRRCIPLILCSAVFLAACGGGTGSRNNNNTNNSNGGSGSPPGQASPVSVAAGQTSTAVDITVSPPASSPPPNAQFLGVGGSSAFGTGAQIHQGQTATVFLFGPGLSANMQVTISGPSDITISNIHGITATDNTPGVAFTASVSSGAGLGGRTVFLMNPQQDITAFTGGLEVVGP